MDPRDMDGFTWVMMGLGYALLTVAAGFLIHVGWDMWDAFLSINW